MPKQIVHPIGFFATPDSVQELQEYIKKFSGSERTVATTVMGMTWNCLAKIVNEAAQEVLDETESKIT